MKIISKILCGLSVIFPAFALNANIIYVDSSYLGEDSIGSKEKPFSKINEALVFAKDKDEIVLREGVYRETLSINKTIKLTSTKGEYVLITACESVGIKDCKPRKIKGHNVYKLPHKGIIYDMFINGEAMEISRYPDKTASMQSNEDWLETDLFPNGEESVHFLEGDMGERDFDNGYYVGSHDERYKENGKIATYYTLSIPVTKTKGEGVVLLDEDEASTGTNNPNSHFGSGLGVGYIIASSAGFDNYNEYFSNEDVTYFILPEGIDDKSALVEYRTRITGVEVEADDVEFEGLHFKANSISVKADGFSMKNCTMRYLAPFLHIENPAGNKSPQSLECQWGDDNAIGLQIKGNGANVDSCYFAHSWWSAIRLWGDNSRVFNCYIEDIDWIGRRASGIHSWGDNNYIAYNTVKNTGGAAIEAGNGAKSWMGVYATNNIFEHNHLSDTTNLLIDQGAFYANQQNGSNPHGNCVFRYNLIENARPPKKLNWSKNCDGVYIDNNTSGYIVHSNIMINANQAMHYNDFAKNVDSVGKDIYFLNNTVINCTSAFAYGLQNHILTDINAKRRANGEAKQAKLKDTNARNLVLANNVATGVKEGFNTHKVEATPLWKNNYLLEKTDFKDIKAYDFLLSESAQEKSPLKIDFAYVLKYAPECADIDYIGAIKPKKAMWEYGSSLKVPSFKDKDIILLSLKVK